MLLSISLPTDHLPTTATLFIAPSIYLPTLIHPPTLHSLTLYPQVPLFNPLTPIVAFWQHTYFRHHNFIKKC